jgi:hypothetical protein
MLFCPAPDRKLVSLYESIGNFRQGQQWDIGSLVGMVIPQTIDTGYDDPIDSAVYRGENRWRGFSF